MIVRWHFECVRTPALPSRYYRHEHRRLQREHAERPRAGDGQDIWEAVDHQKCHKGYFGLFWAFWTDHALSSEPIAR